MDRNLTVIAIVLLSIALLASPALAAPPKVNPLEKLVARPTAVAEVTELVKEKLGKGDLDLVQAAMTVQQVANDRKRDARADKILKALDQDGDGKLNLYEAHAGVLASRAVVPGAGKAVADMFDKLDVSKNGFISNDEFALLLKQLGGAGVLLQPKLAEFFNKLDANRDVQISFSEAMMFADYVNDQILTGGANTNTRPKIDPTAYKTAFNRVNELDRDYNGSLSIVETKKDTAIHRAYRTLDTDGNGALTVEELYVFYAPNAEAAAAIKK